MAMICWITPVWVFLVLAILKLAFVIVSDLTAEPELLSAVMLIHVHSKYACSETDAIKIP
jgi:hypothetical protein